MSSRCNLLPILVLLVAAFLLTGMGMGGEDGPTRIPEPEADYKVRLTSLDGSRVTLTQFSIEGQSYVMGGLGNGQLAVPFDKVKKVTFGSKGGKLKATLEVDNEKPVELEVKGSLKAYGKTGYGNYSIELSEVSAIEVLGRAQP